MADEALYPVPDSWTGQCLVDEARYDAEYAESIRDNTGYWAEQAKRIDWIKAPTQIKDVSFGPDDVHIRWYEDGQLNVCANCVDRHLADKADQTAIIWEGDSPDESKEITYRELHEQVSRLGNVLKAMGVGKGDVVTLYMPMIPEAAYAMLACARIGAVHSVVFAGFSPDALAGRIEDGRSRFVITADEGYRGGRTIALKTNVDAALERPGAQHVEQALIGQIGMHTRRPEADQAGEMMRVSGRGCVDNDVGVGAQAFTDQCVMDGAGGHQSMDRQLTGRQATIGENDHHLAAADGLDGLVRDAVDGGSQALVFGPGQSNTHVCIGRIFQRQQLLVLAGGQYGGVHQQAFGAVWCFLEHAAFGAQARLQRHDDLLT